MLNTKTVRKRFLLKKEAKTFDYWWALCGNGRIILFREAPAQ
jgi:hypothetical protein